MALRRAQLIVALYLLWWQSFMWAFCGIEQFRRSTNREEKYGNHCERPGRVV